MRGSGQHCREDEADEADEAAALARTLRESSRIIYRRRRGRRERGRGRGFPLVCRNATDDVDDDENDGD